MCYIKRFVSQSSRRNPFKQPNRQNNCRNHRFHSPDSHTALTRAHHRRQMSKMNKPRASTQRRFAFTYRKPTHFLHPYVVHTGWTIKESTAVVERRNGNYVVDDGGRRKHGENGTCQQFWSKRPVGRCVVVVAVFASVVFRLFQRLIAVQRFMSRYRRNLKENTHPCRSIEKSTT